MGQVVAWAFISAVNPTLLAATTLMFLLERPGRLMLGYWLGSMFVSLTLGLVIIFAIQGSSLVKTTKHTASPIVDFALAATFLILTAVLATGRDRGVQERRQSHKAKRGKENKTPRWQQQLNKGTARTTFIIGALLGLPGASYLIGLEKIDKLHYSTAVTVLLVLGFNLVQFLLIEVPMISFRIAPTRTPIAIDGAKEWAMAHWRIAAVWALMILGALFAVKGIVAAT